MNKRIIEPNLEELDRQIAADDALAAGRTALGLAGALFVQSDCKMDRMSCIQVLGAANTLLKLFEKMEESLAAEDWGKDLDKVFQDVKARLRDVEKERQGLLDRNNALDAYILERSKTLGTQQKTLSDLACEADDLRARWPEAVRLIEQLEGTSAENADAKIKIAKECLEKQKHVVDECEENIRKVLDELKELYPSGDTPAEGEF